MVLFLELLATGIVVGAALVLPASYWMAKLLNQEPPDLARLFRRHAQPSIRLAVIETPVQTANTVVERPPTIGPRPTLIGSVSAYGTLVTVVQTERRLAG
jgi:hypothetical protein